MKMTVGPDSIPSVASVLSAASVCSVPIQTRHNASKKILPAGRHFARVRSSGLKRREIGTDRYLISFDLAQGRPGDFPQDQPFDFVSPGMPLRFFPLRLCPGQAWRSQERERWGLSLLGTIFLGFAS